MLRGNVAHLRGPVCMRILFVTQIVPYPPHGGVLQRGFNLLRELGRTHDVHLLAFHHPDELPPGEALEQSRAELGKFCSAVEYFELWPKKSSAHRFLGLGLAAMHPAPFSVLAHRNRKLSQRISELCQSESTAGNRTLGHGGAGTVCSQLSAGSRPSWRITTSSPS